MVRFIFAEKGKQTKKQLEYDEIWNFIMLRRLIRRIFFSVACEINTFTVNTLKYEISCATEI